MTKLLAALGFLAFALPAHAHPHSDATAPEARGAERAWLGVNLQDLDDDLREAIDIPSSVDGVLVPRVMTDSPARKAGLKSHDVITMIDGKRVRSSDDVAELIGESKPGEAVSITVWRDGETKDLSATLGSTDDQPGENWSWFSPDIDDDNATPRSGRFGFDDDADANGDKDKDREQRRFMIRRGDRAPRVLNLDENDNRGYLGVQTMQMGEQLAQYFGVKTDGGVLVTEVVADSPAAKAGIAAGDVILSVGGDAVADPEDLRREIRGHDAGASVEVRVSRRGSERTFSVTLGEAGDFGMLAPTPDGGLWQGRRFEVPVPDLSGLRGLELDMDPKDWESFQHDLRHELKDLKDHLKDLRLKIRMRQDDGGERGRRGV